MSEQPFANMPPMDWLARYAEQRGFDTISIWDIAADLRRTFRIQGSELECVIHDVVTELLKSGAYPIAPSVNLQGYWEKTDRFGSSLNEIVSGVIADWRAAENNPDIDDIWFGLPEVYSSP